MIGSGRICQLHRQFAQLRLLVHSCRQHSRKSVNLADSPATKRLSSDLERRHFSTPTNLPDQTKIMSGEGDRKAFDLYYDDLLQAQKDDTVLIVDVREMGEIQETGKLPGSIHIPMKLVPHQLTDVSDEAFINQFGKPKPTKNTKIIFSCRSGKRSAMVQEEMQKLGFDKAYNYTGGWLEWESKQKL